MDTSRRKSKLSNRMDNARADASPLHPVARRSSTVIHASPAVDVVEFDPTPWWTMQRGDDCVLATAIHDGSRVRQEVERAMAIQLPERLREEDPFTGQAIVDVPNHIIVQRSRFEIDLNRAEPDAVYRTREQSWGLNVWHRDPDEALVKTSRRMYQAFYSQLASLTDELAARHGRFVVLDVHSYNHRREGALAAPMPVEQAPEVNIGTYSMPRKYWSFLMDPLISAMRTFDFNGRNLDVRENVAFEGRGELARFVHERHRGVGCAIAIEFKKFYMDEWSGTPDVQALQGMRGFIRQVAEFCRKRLCD